MSHVRLPLHLLLPFERNIIEIGQYSRISRTNTCGRRRPSFLVVRSADTYYTTLLQKKKKERKKKPLFLLPLPVSGVLLESRGHCTQRETCRCPRAVFNIQGVIKRLPSTGPNHLCICQHPWWMHVVNPPPSTGHGCPASHCGGYYPQVIHLFIV